MVVGHPALLFRSTEAHPENIGSGGMYLSCEICFFGLCERAKGRRVGAGHGNVELFVKLARQVLRDTGSAAVEEMTRLRTCLTTKCEHQLRSRNATAQRMSMPPAQPNERHAVWNHQRSLIQDFAKARILPRFGDAVHTGDRNIFAVLAIVDPAFDSRHSFRQLNRINANANDAECRRDRAHCSGAGFKHRRPAFARKWSSIECRPSLRCSDLRTLGARLGPLSLVRMDVRKPTGLFARDLRRRAA